MKRLLAAALVSTVLATPVVAADLDDTLPPGYTSFVSVSFLYSFGILDQGFEITDGADRLSGSFDPEYALGATLEAGVFLNERVRLSSDVRYSRTQYDSVSLLGQTVNLRSGDVEADRVQVFVNAAYEVPLADVGLAVPFFERSSVFALVGVGLTNFELDLDGQSGDETAFTAKIGLGTATAITDRVALVAETNYIFGSDFTFEDGRDRLEFDNEEIVSTIGLRFSF